MMIRRLGAYYEIEQPSTQRTGLPLPSKRWAEMALRVRLLRGDGSWRVARHGMPHRVKPIKAKAPTRRERKLTRLAEPAVTPAPKPAKATKPKRQPPAHARPRGRRASTSAAARAATARVGALTCHACGWRLPPRAAVCAICDVSLGSGPALH
jgi:hypothetical protein